MSASHKTKNRRAVARARLVQPVAAALAATLLLILFPLPSALAQPARPLTFAEALALAQRESPGLAAQRHALGAAESAVVPASQLPDPKLALGVDNLPVDGPDRWRLTRDFMTMRRVGVMQDVPNAAKRAAQREAAGAKAERERSMLETERLAVRREAALAWLSLHFAEKKLAAFGALELQNRLLQDTLAARVTSGAASPSEALMARQDALDLADRRDELLAGVEQARALLKRWTGDQPDLSAYGEAPDMQPDLSRLLGDLDRHVDLRAFSPMLAMAQADVDEARAMRQGDWGWEVAYANRARAFGDMVSFQLTFELPVSKATRQEPVIASRQKEVERLQAERDDALRRVRADVDAQVTELQRLERALQRQQGQTLPLAQERAQVTLASYQTGRADLGAVLAARKNAIEAQLRALDLQSQVSAQQARLSHLIAE